VFVLVNNRYSISVSVEKATGMKTLSARAEGYGIPGVTVDGNDVRKVHSEAQKAIKRAREGKGPTLLQCLVHRWTGPSISDADVYRSERERKEGERNDPVLRCRKELISEGILTEQEYDKIEKHVESEIEDAVQYSETQCTDPDPSDILRGVYGS
jgi:TPP-dependent pyruvate/acetoin dehydrogenase alpha subunit